MFGTGLGGNREREEVVFEFTPEPAAPRSEDVDVSATPPKDAREVRGGGARDVARPRRREFESMGVTPALQKFEPPEQRLTRLQAEVAELLRVAEGSTAQDGPKAAEELLGADPAAMMTELKVLEQRLGGLARDAPPSWRKAGEAGGEDQATGPCTMSGSLVSQLEKLATGSGATGGSAGDGRVTYEISYAPSTAAIVESSKIAALESSIADIEKQLGVLEPSCPFTDLRSAVSQLQKRVSLLDNQRLDSIRNGVHKVKADIEQVLEKKDQLEGGSGDQELDRKVAELYEFCNRWNAAAASLPSIVTRLRTLQGIHQQSTTFAARLAALEKQQDELHKLLETTNVAVQELSHSLKENMTIVRDNMKSFEEKMSNALRS